MRTIAVYTITAGYSGLMAILDGPNLVGWTPWVKEATHFLSRREATEAIEGLCRAKREEAVRRGHVVREYDPEQDEVVYMDYSGRHAGPMRRPAIGGTVYVHDAVNEPASFSPRDFTRQTFREAARNPVHSTAPRVGPRYAPDEYTTPVSRQGRVAAAAQAMAAYARG